MKEDVLPEGWEIKKLESLADILDSQRKPINSKEREKRIQGKSDNKLFPYYGATGEVGKIDDYLFDEELVALGEDGVPFLDFNKDKAYMLYGKTWVNNHAHVLRAKKGITENKFLYYFLNQFDYRNYVNGGTRLKLTQANMRKIPVITPPLPEQQYLSQKLTALLDEVAQTKQRLEAIPAQLKQFRQSVLADAVSGRLTEEWRENKEYELIDKLTFPKGWMKSTLGKEFNYGSCKKKSPDEILNQDWVLELEDIEKDNSNILNKITNATRQAQSTKNVFKKGDVLYGKLRPYLNKIVIADGDGVCTTEIIPISSNERICNQYLFYWLKSPYFFNYVNEITYGVNMPRLGTQDGKKAIIVFPPKEEQTQIVQKVETYFALADEIETQVKAALENVNLLTQSILAKAFSGELSAAWRTQQAVKN